MRGVRNTERGSIFRNRNSRLDQRSEQIPEIGAEEAVPLSSRLAYFAFLDMELSAGNRDVLDEYEKSLGDISSCSTGDLADAIVESGIINVLRNGPQDDPGVNSLIVMFKGILEYASDDDQSSHELILDRIPKSVRMAMGAAVTTAMLSQSMQAAAVETVNNASGSASSTTSTSSTVIYPGATQTAPMAVASASQPQIIEQILPQQADEVMVFGAAENSIAEAVMPAAPVSNSLEQAPLSSESVGLVRVFEQTPEGVVEVTDKFEAESEIVAPVHMPEVASSIAELLGIQAPDEFILPGQNKTHPELNVAPTHPAKVSVMSYNILGAKAAITHRNGGGYSWLQRLRAATSVIKDENPSIIGLQEVDEKQFRVLQRELSDTYDSYPAKYVSGAKRPIFWQASEFDLIDKGMYKIDRYGNPKTLSPWVKLRAKDGQEFYMYNIHMSAGGAKDARKYGGGKTNVPPPKQRAKQAGQLIAAINRTNKEDLPALITGDFNSTCEKTSRDGGVPFQKIPCVQLQNADFLDAGVVTKAEGTAKNAAYSTSHLKAGKERRTGGRHIDRIMGTKKGVKFMEWKNVVEDEDVEIAGDHTPVVSEVIVGDPVDLIDEN